MMRTMADSTTAAALPAYADLYAAYLDGAYANVGYVVARCAGKVVVEITVDPASDHGTVGDGPPDNGTWAQWTTWVARRRASGAVVTMYTDAAELNAGRQAFSDVGLNEPEWWVADWTGVAPDALPPGVVAVQYASPTKGSPGPYDLSVVADHWLGVDTTPAPSHAPTYQRAPTPAPFRSTGSLLVPFDTWADTVAAAEAGTAVYVRTTVTGKAVQLDLAALRALEHTAAPDTPQYVTYSEPKGYAVQYNRDGTISVLTGAPVIVKGTDGRTRLTCSDTGLTNLTPQYQGTLGDPTPAARKAATVVDTIRHLTALGQNRRAVWLPPGTSQP